MNDALKKANEALLEGDRDGVLKYLEYEPNTPEVLWLRANAVLDDDERIALLKELVNGYSKYTPLAGEFLERELESQRQLDEPPDHHFWKKPTWKKILAQKYWILGLLFAIIMGVVYLSSFISSETERRVVYEEGVEQAIANQTEVARLEGQPLVEYDAGTLSIIDIDDPTKEQVTFGRTDNNQQYIIEEPATGTRFVAVQVNFQCAQAICEQAPQANLALNLQNGKTVSYQSSARPFLVSESPDSIPRISQGAFTKIWYVFEVPRSTNPKTLSVSALGQEEPLLLSWSVH